jgi:hypothetical protein
MEAVTYYKEKLIDVYLNEILNFNHLFLYSIVKNNDSDKMMDIDVNMLRTSIESS